MKKLNDVRIREATVEGRIVYLCVTSDEIKLFYCRENAKEFALKMTRVMA